MRIDSEVQRLLRLLTPARAGYIDLIAPTALTYGTWTDTSQASTNADFSLFESQVTITNPGTVLTQAFSITARGKLLVLSIAKPNTTNSVAVNATITIDGVDVVSDTAVTAANTLGRTGYFAGTTSRGNCAIYLPFETGFRVQVRYSGTPGASENITLRYVAAYR